MVTRRAIAVIAAARVRDGRSTSISPLTLPDGPYDAELVTTPIAIVSGSGGLVGSECVRRFSAQGFDVVGIDNDMRAVFFGEAATTRHVSEQLAAELDTFHPSATDIRDADGIASIFERHAGSIALVVHAAAQPSHDWAAGDPQTDFAINANGTLNMLEAARRHAPDATFVFTSTNKVYGDRPNSLPLEEHATRLELPVDHRWHGGIDLGMSIDACTHSLFGVSKVAADLLVQEYARYFGMPTVSLRCGCLTGPQHAGAQLHGFLAYLMRCTVTGVPYTIFGYGGKQVRDNLHAADLCRAIAAIQAAPRAGAVYNLGGGRESNVSMLEAIAACERIAGLQLRWTMSDQARVGDHRWWISDVDTFRTDYPSWSVSHGIEDVLLEIHDSNRERWVADAAAAANG
jgi:CDP-paratose 2-epimerase